MLLEGEEVVKGDMAECKLSLAAMKVSKNQLLLGTEML
jgi:hypothetical protein